MKFITYRGKGEAWAGKLWQDNFHDYIIRDNRDLFIVTALPSRASVRSTG